MRRREWKNKDYTDYIHKTLVPSMMTGKRNLYLFRKITLKLTEFKR